MRRKRLFQSEEASLEEPFINLTPLIDVVFVVLITFMLIAPFLEMDAIQLAQGGGKEKEDFRQTSISITVQADNSIWFRGKKVTLSQLSSLLKQEKKKCPKETPKLLQDRKAHFGTYQEIKNCLESLGFEQLDVVLKPG